MKRKGLSYLSAKERAALDELKHEGFVLIVVTNQPDIARGSANRVDVDKINGQLAAILPLDGIEVCEHDDQERCDCRKPKPGMILRAQEKLGRGSCQQLRRRRSLARYRGWSTRWLSHHFDWRWLR